MSYSFGKNGSVFRPKLPTFITPSNVSSKYYPSSFEFGYYYVLEYGVLHYSSVTTFHWKTPSWNTTRLQRSSLSFYKSWWASVCSLGDICVDNRRIISDPKLSPTDTISYTHIASEMASRLGTGSIPSLALNQRHVH